MRHLHMADSFPPDWARYPSLSARSGHAPGEAEARAAAAHARCSLLARRARGGLGGRRQAALAVTAYGAFLQPAPGRRRLRGHAAGVSPSGGRRGRAGEQGRLAERSFGGKPRQQSSLLPALRPVRPGWPPASQGPGRAQPGLPVGARGGSAGPVEGGGGGVRGAARPLIAARSSLNDSARAGRDWLPGF